MKITFHGAAQTVTGSRHLITTDKGTNILLDCGLFQGRGADTDTLNRHFGFNPVEVDFLILSHAHIDHSGNIPSLVKQGFTGKIFCTPATFELCKILLADSAHIHESDIEYINKRRRKKRLPPLETLYTIDDVNRCFQYFNTVELNTWTKIGDECEFMYTDSGHILGAAAVNLKIKDKEKNIRFFFSGDIGRYNDQILRPPQPFPQADYILCESTYGDRLHEEVADAEKKLLNVIIETCLKRGGKIIIPAFSLGRTQEVVYALDRMRTQKILPPVDVYVDSPLSVSATDLMRKFTGSFNPAILEYIKHDPDPFGFDKLHYISDVNESKALNDNKAPCIIISASGMMEAGRIKHHVKNNVGDARNTILIVGFCAEGSLGANLLAGEKKVRIFGEYYDVKARVVKISSYSAHADYTEMLKYLSCQDKAEVKKIFLVHGEYPVQKIFSEKLFAEGYHAVEIPKKGESVELA